MVQVYTCTQCVLSCSTVDRLRLSDVKLSKCICYPTVFRGDIIVMVWPCCYSKYLRLSLFTGMHYRTEVYFFSRIYGYSHFWDIRSFSVRENALDQKIIMNIFNFVIYNNTHDGCLAMQANVVSNILLVNHCLLWSGQQQLIQLLIFLLNAYNVPCYSS